MVNNYFEVFDNSFCKLSQLEQLNISYNSNYINKIYLCLKYFIINKNTFKEISQLSSFSVLLIWLGYKIIRIYTIKIINQNNSSKSLFIYEFIKILLVYLNNDSNML